jgi:SAM-dependent methyltransferase
VVVLLKPASTGPHAPGGAPSAWVGRFAGLIAPGGSVLDVACGSGRHAVWLAAQGLGVTGVDRNADALQGLPAGIEAVHADLEGAPWPLTGRRFDGIVVTNYLWRPLWPDLLAALAPGGVFIHETFALGQQRYGKPSRPDFLLQPGELLRVCADLRVVAFEEGLEAEPTRCVQRIAAVRVSHGDTDASAHPLRPGAGVPGPAR